VVLRANHVDDATAAVGTEFDGAWCQGEERVVLATADIVARVEVSATLTHDDLTGVNLLTTETLYAQALCI
jgi:hypothetical protein